MTVCEAPAEFVSETLTPVITLASAPEMVNGMSSLKVPPFARPAVDAKYALNAALTSIVTVPPPSIDCVVVKVRVIDLMSRVVVKPITSTVKPAAVPLMIFTVLGVMAGAVPAMVNDFDGGGVGSTLSMPAINRVKVNVKVPATVPGENTPLPGSAADFAPFGMVKLIDVPPAANCIAGST